jgi:aminoglycoside phosphotransferase (APT) family kinase protein
MSRDRVDSTPPPTATPAVPPTGIPEAEIAIDEDLVRALLEAQHPDLAHLPLRPLAHGWDNVLFRLGDARVVRLPRRAVAAELNVNEQRWLPVLRDPLPIPTPSPERIGVGDAHYPWAWSVLPWLEGGCADLAPPAAGEAVRFADFLRALHVPAPARAPRNPVRGVPLAEREAGLRERMERIDALGGLIDGRIRAGWDRALGAPAATEARWLHGDLHAQNVLVDDGRLSGVIDWGDLAAGDVATDLAGIWSLFDTRAARERALDRYAPDEALAARARGWAILFGVVLADAGRVDSPRHMAQGRALLSRIREGP